MLKLSIIITFVLFLTACPIEDTSNGDKGLGENLNLSGQVYTQTFMTEIDPFANIITYNEYQGNLALSDELGGTGNIAQGLFNYASGKPNNLQPVQDGLSLLTDMYNDVKFSSNNVNAAVIQFTSADNSGNNYMLLNEKTGDVSLLSLIMGGSIIIENLQYVYVDNDITINAKGRDFDYDIVIKMDLKTSDISLNLKKGWNPLFSVITANIDLSNIDFLNIDPEDFDISDIKIGGNLEMSVPLELPSLNWTLFTSGE